MSRTPNRGGSILARLDATAARRWAVLARAALATRRAEIDALNVFPVPDGDTGTNMYLTFDAALDAALDAARAERESRHGSGGEPTLAASAAGLARAALLAARGNSGVILSQLVRGISEVVGDPALGPDGLDGAALARALRRASDLARESVTRPVEGTILTVAAAAADAAESAVDAAGSLYDVTTRAVAAARDALARTTSQLAALERAGVVDAGAAGYVLLLEALEDVVAGGESDHHLAPGAAPRTGWAAPSGARPQAGEDYAGPAYEVMFLLSHTSAAAVAELRERLDDLGESLLVVGGPDLWNVHVHVDDAGAAIEAGVAAGRPHRIRVAHLGTRPPQTRTTPASAVAVVACVAGDGLAEVLRGAGALVVPSGPGRRPSTGQILDAVRGSHALSVLVLPGDRDTQLAADAAAAAAAQEGIEVLVVRSRAAVQDIAALAVFDPTQGARDNLVTMSSAAAATRHGAVCVAGREALTSAGWCQAGDVLGIVDDDIAVLGRDLAQVGTDVVERLLGSGGELLTVVTGADAPAGLGEAVASAARRHRRDIEVTVIAGGQPAYPLLLGVE